MDPETEEIILFAISAVVACWVGWLLFRRHHLQQEVRMRTLEIQREILKKFESPSELIAFLKTKEGLGLFPEKSFEKPRRLRFVVFGVVLILVAAAMARHAYSIRELTDPNYANQMRDYYYWASLCGAGGVGFILHSVLQTIFSRDRQTQ